ncbi:MAG: SUMF1/EgtB/PvdO family nonheme iron enzyme [Gammaproteobacteria bacterium]|nr:SUMF1/EgtB/PvdO family nonheme iron enzyme [Gammaproteobacteria bacterium]
MFNRKKTTTGISLLLASYLSTLHAAEYIAPPMINIPGGSFMMGTDGGDPATTPIHSVSIDAFQMSKYLVTVAEFKKFAEDTGFVREATCNDFIDNEGLRGPTYQGSGSWNKHRYTYSDYQPVVCISWQDADDYAQWLSIKTGIKYRLPTEQEWEYAAKANTTTRYFWGDDPTMSQACKYGNFADETGEHTNNQQYGLSNIGWIGVVNCDDSEAYNSIVGLYRPNPFGLYDMLGNVSEFVNSCYSANGYQDHKEATKDNCEFIVHRGGNWHYPAAPTSTRGRFKRTGWNVSTGQGFRLAVSGHEKTSSPSSDLFEAQLKSEQSKHLTNRNKLLDAPKNVNVVKVAKQTFNLSWQPSEDNRITGYDIYRSISSTAHLYAGLYSNHYKKVQTVPAEKNSINVNLPAEGGSFRVLAIANQTPSLPSKPAVNIVAPKVVEIPGQFDMQHATELVNVRMYHFEAKDKLPEAYSLFKTNKNSDKTEVSATFKVNIKKSGWYQLNYSGRTFHEGVFFKLWQENRLVGSIDFDTSIDDKISTRHKVYLEAGEKPLEITVMRDKFDRWGLGWLKFTDINDHL